MGAEVGGAAALGLGPGLGLSSQARAGELSEASEAVVAIVDQLSAVLLTSEATPLQGLIFDQLAKILAAQTRSAWGQVRKGLAPSSWSKVDQIFDQRFTLLSPTFDQIYKF